MSLSIEIHRTHKMVIVRWLRPPSGCYKLNVVGARETILVILLREVLFVIHKAGLFFRSVSSLELGPTFGQSFLSLLNLAF